MICRLCLEETDDILNIYTDTGEMADQEMLLVIAKHFEIEIHYDDAVSNTICSICWGYLKDFHTFWLSIDEKQKTLSSQLQFVQIKRDIEDLELAAITHTKILNLNDEKVLDSGLCQSVVDVFIPEGGFGETEFVGTKIEQENDESTFDDDVFSEPLTEAIDMLSKDAEPEENKPAAGKKRENAKRNQKVKSKVAAGKKLKKRGRPRLTEIAKKREDSNQISEVKKAEKAKSQKRMKSMQEADNFIAENIELACCICMEKLKDFKELKGHYRKYHQCTGYVICCDLRFTKRTLYVDHLQLHKNPDFFKCTICDKQLISRKNYVNHMHSLHPAEENLQFACQHCPRKFSKQYILDSHIKMRHLPKNHICKLCDKAFMNIWILSQHEKAVHRNEFESVCEICGKRLRNAANLQYHMDNIHNTEPRPEVECTICHKWLKSERTLRKHMISHRDVAAGVVFKCPQCDMEKSTRHSLSSHIRYHHSNRVFPCTMCGKEFKTPIGLKEHEATHTGVDLYTCPFCPKTFRSHANMHKHKIHSHSDEWVRKYAQPNEYTLSVLKQTHTSNNDET